MRQIRILSLAALAVLGAVRTYAADITVIANPSVKASSISAADLKGVFLEIKSSLADGGRVEPVLEKSGAVHDAFLKAYLGKTDSSLESYYRSLVFTGKAFMPKVLAGDAEVVAYVARTKGAIGYVSSRSQTLGVKTLKVE